jgi:DNA-binding GntR family transcriptional regulator
MTLEKIKWLYELRVAVECVAVRELTRRRRKSDLRLLRLSVADIRNHARRGDLRAVTEAEGKFHDTLCRLCGNPYVQNVNNSLSALVRMALVLDNAAYTEPEHIAEEHEPVLAAIESGDEERAVSAISYHIMASIRNLFVQT